MKKGNIILIIIIAVIVAVVIVLVVKKFFTAPEDVDPPSPSGQIIPPPPPAPTPTDDTEIPEPAPTIIGKTAYAKFNGVKVWTPQFQVYKTINTGEYAGKIYSVRTDGYLVISGNNLVYQGLIEAK